MRASIKTGGRVQRGLPWGRNGSPEVGADWLGGVDSCRGSLEEIQLADTLLGGQTMNGGSARWSIWPQRMR